jgi:hypothetical protein
LPGDELKNLMAFLNALTGAIPKQALEVPLLPAREEY